MGFPDDRVLVGDGAMGTMLMKRGLKIGECPELFTLERPEDLVEIHSSYFTAGADIIETNTFGASPLKLASYNAADRCEKIVENAVMTARQAVGPDCLVALSVGPCGHMLLPFGDVDEETVRAGFSRQIGAGLDAGVDLICVETMIALGEARLAAQATRQLNATIPLIVSMSFEITPQGCFTIMGDSVAECAAVLVDEGTTLIGANCGHGVEQLLVCARELNEHTTIPLVIQPNAGMPEHRGGEIVYPEDPQTLAARVPELVRTGVRLIGGCCGTTPDHIRALRQAVDALQS